MILKKIYQVLKIFQNKLLVNLLYLKNMIPVKIIINISFESIMM